MLFRMLVGKMPLRRISEALGMTPPVVVDRIAFIHRQCVAFVSDRERRLTRMNIPRLRVSVDGQEYAINWRSHLIRRNVSLMATATVCNDTGYCFAAHFNYDPDLNRTAEEAAALAAGDADKPYALRRRSRVWLSTDYAAIAARWAARQAARRGHPTATVPIPGLGGDIASSYAAQQEREDIEDPMPETPRRTLPDKGMQTRRDYLLHAHFRYLDALCPNVGKWRFYMDQDPGMRAAFLSSFASRILDGTADGFYVRIEKDATIVEKNKALAAAKAAFEAEKVLHPGKTDREIVVGMVRARMAAMTPFGKWNDRWLLHPKPTMSEPALALSWLTERPAMNRDHAAALYALGSLHGVDSLFNRMRRRVAMLERPIRTPRSGGRVWSAYASYDPSQTARMVEIVRVCHNFVWKSDKDGKTPAMRIGLARAPLDYDDILRFIR
jgi:hypothetical protein